MLTNIPIKALVLVLALETVGFSAAAADGDSIEPHADTWAYVLRAGLEPTEGPPEPFPFKPPTDRSTGDAKTRWIRAAKGRAPVYGPDRGGRPRHRLGSILMGQFVAAQLSEYRCDSGRAPWYFLRSGVYLCGRDFLPASVSLPGAPWWPPRVDKELPFPYRRVAAAKARRWSQRPRPDWVRRMKDGRVLPTAAQEAIREEMEGAYFLTAVQEVSVAGVPFVETARREYVQAKHLEPVPKTKLHGVPLKGREELPLAFVYGAEEIPLLCPQNGEMKQCGLAEKHAHFSFRGRRHFGDEEYVKGPEEWWIRRSRVRVIRAVQRPERIEKYERWIHVELGSQTLTAYEGDTPRFATLVSSGKHPKTTPRGLYRIRRKHISRTMRGPDAEVGRYHVAEVPWAMYYRRRYAVHGAYWHNDFGMPRSHGCTNLAPGDARWLFHFTEPDIPDDWHTIRNAKGSWIYLSGTTET